MPITQDKRGPAKQALILGIAALAAIGVIVFLVTRLGPSENTSSISQRPGDESVFRIGKAEELAPIIAESGPLLLGDPSPGDLHIFVQHNGEPTNWSTGWLVFRAQPEGLAQTCIAAWSPKDNNFVEPCEGQTFPANGEGLQHFKVDLEADGTVRVDLSAPLLN